MLILFVNVISLTTTVIFSSGLLMELGNTDTDRAGLTLSWLILMLTARLACVDGDIRRDSYIVDNGRVFSVIAKPVQSALTLCTDSRRIAMNNNITLVLKRILGALEAVRAVRTTLGVQKARLAFWTLTPFISVRPSMHLRN